MSTPDYLKHLKPIGKGKTPASASAKGNDPPKQKRRLEPQQGSASETDVVIIDRVPPRQASRGASADAVFLERGELWKKGVSDDLRLVLSPPSQFSCSSPLKGDMLAALRRMEEESLKAISLIQSFEELHLGYEASSSSAAALALQVEELKKAQSELAAEKSGLEAVVTGLKADLEKAGKDRDLAETACKVKDDRIKQLEVDYLGLETAYGEAQSTIGKAAQESFDNAIAQVQVLNPGLITDGVGLACFVQDGRIVPYSFGDDEHAEPANADGPASPSEDE